MKISKYLGTFALLAMLAACSTEDPENETYVTNDADGKHFHSNLKL